MKLEAFICYFATYHIYVIFKKSKSYLNNRIAYR